MPGLRSFLAPTMQELQQRLLIRIELFERLAFDARNNRGYQPFRFVLCCSRAVRDLLASKGCDMWRSHWCSWTEPRVPQPLAVRPPHSILSAYATNARLVLGQLSVPEKTNEITAILELLHTLEDAGQLKGAHVTIDAMGCQVDIA